MATVNQSFEQWIEEKVVSPLPQRLQLQAEVRQLKAQLRALEIAYNSLRQDYEAMKEGVKDGR